MVSNACKNAREIHRDRFDRKYEKRVGSPFLLSLILCGAVILSDAAHRKFIARTVSASSLCLEEREAVPPLLLPFGRRGERRFSK